MAFENGFRQRPAMHDQTPRRVRGGIKPKAKEWPISGLDWLARNWLSIFREGVSEDEMLGGWDYATRGQTRTIEILPGRVVAAVQGHRYRAVETIIEVPVFTHDEWERLIEKLSDESIHAARLLAGEITPDIEPVMQALSLSFLPQSFTDLTVSHAVESEPTTSPYAMCTAILASELIQRDPFHVFTLRGMPSEELLERLRQRRTATASGGRSAQLFAGLSLMPGEATPLESLTDRFWESAESTGSLDTAPRRPEVPHALLRRLGPSPFSQSKFPLVGLLATCYDMISNAAIQGEATPPSVTTEAPSNQEATPEPEPTKPAMTAAEVIRAKAKAKRAAKPIAKAAAKKK
ncbi:MAG: hypothetical protein AAGB34_01160 [Planctomycetota bacterium]